MDASELKFQKGQKVKHKLGDRPMIVVDFEAATSFFVFGSGTDDTPANYSGNVICKWVDDKNFPQQATYSQEELEPLD